MSRKASNTGEQAYKLSSEGDTFAVIAEKLKKTVGSVRVAAFTYAARNGFKLEPVGRINRGNTKKIVFGCTAQEYSAYKSSAAKAKMSISEFVRSTSALAAGVQ